MKDYEKSPCLHCTRCENPEACTDRHCAAWHTWFLESWENIHRLAKGDGIGDRMIREVKRLCKEQSISHLQFASYSAFNSWSKGRAPQASFLAKLTEWGGDVVWVLTGKRGAPR